MDISWEIAKLDNEFWLIHKHGPVKICALTETQACHLCKEPIPTHFLIQKDLLNVGMAINSRFIDFYHGDNDWSYYCCTTGLLSIDRNCENDLELFIKKLFKGYAFNITGVRYYG